MKHFAIAAHQSSTMPGNCADTEPRTHDDLIAERRRRQDELLDAALLETFPASDPVSVMCLV